MKPDEIFNTIKDPRIYRNFLIHLFVMAPITLYIVWLGLMLDRSWGLTPFLGIEARAVISALLFFAGTVIVVYSYAYLLIFGGGSPGSHLGGPLCLVAKGPYALVRHPSVIGKLLGVIALGVFCGSLSFVVLFVPLLLVYSLATNRFVQERNCETVFGSAYKEYRLSVPMIVPRMRDLALFFRGKLPPVELGVTEISGQCAPRSELAVYLALHAALLVLLSIVVFVLA